MPTPLWATIAAVLAACLYTHIRMKLFRSSDKSHTEIITKLLPAEGFKWEARIKNKALFGVSEIPFCRHHDLRLIKFNDTYGCTENNCKTSIEAADLKVFYQVATSYIERDIRNKYS